MPGAGRGPYRIRASDAAGTIDLVWFHPRAEWLARMLPTCAVRVVSGRIDQFQGALQMSHPDRIAEPDDTASVETVEPVHPLTAGLAPKTLAKAVAAALERVPALPEWQDPAWLARRGWTGFRAALDAAHAPREDADLSALAPARQRLAYDELLASQLALGLIRAGQRRRPGRPTRGDGRLRRAVETALPFALTGAQRMALAE